MKEFLIREALVPNMVAATKEEAVRELVGALHAAGYFTAEGVPAVVKEIMRREGLGSTGIGRGVAIPHSRFDGLPKLVGALGLSRAGVPFQSIDGHDVHLIFLLVSRPDQPGPHLHLLETIVRVSESDEFLAAMRACETQDQMWELIQTTPDPWAQDEQ